MKLLMIMAIREYREELSKALGKSGVSIYSELDLRGFKTNHHTPDPMNWFASGLDPDSSLLVLAVVEENKVSPIMEELIRLNEMHEGLRPSHAFQIQVEKFI